MTIKVRFDKLIEVKENLLSEKKKELQYTVSSFEMISQEIITIEEDIKRNYAQLSLVVLDSNEVYVLREHIIWLEAKKSTLLKEKDKLEKIINSLKTELAHILKEIKMLETLKSKALYSLKKTISRKEQKKLDELALRLNLKSYQR
ncbi:MAG TPA: hypothetical protein PLM71_03050 [Syntrophorhabdaceae bacterium]|nr:hypothetical protein [Syntrophorhabdaceae bacterium]HPU29283.1 hypothetical protein [Syntrophorhabdaceae bacterium]